MEYKLDTNGYRYIYEPSNPYANKAGKVYEHIAVMCNHIQRRLNSNECVHHIDRDKTNNALENLRLLTLSEHARLHLIEDRKIKFKSVKCRRCGKTMIVSESSEQQYCCAKCFQLYRREFNITKEDLFILVWTMPTIKVAELLGISDVAVGKRCKIMGVPKPPRGYWRKVETGKIVPSIPNQNIF